MSKNSTDFQIPTLARLRAYDFEVSENSFQIYQELNQIAEEIDRCRARNC